MKAIFFKETGAWQENLQLGELTLREPASGEVQVRIKARPVNPSDIMFIEGVYRHKPELPQIAGWEGAGIIEKCGPSVSPSLAGKKVSFRARGSWAEKINLNAANLHMVPEDMPFELACQLSLNTMTAYGLLESAKLQEGQWLLLTAANSSVGRQLIQLCRLRGIRVIAMVRRQAQAARLRALGAEEVLLAHEGNHESVIHALTNGGVHGIFDAVGGSGGNSLLHLLAPYGCYLLYGHLNRQDVFFDYRTILSNNIRIEGFGIDQWKNSHSAEERALIWEEILHLVRKGALQPGYDLCFPLDRFKDALFCYEQSRRKVILVG